MWGALLNNEWLMLLPLTHATHMHNMGPMELLLVIASCFNVCVPTCGCVLGR